MLLDGSLVLEHLVLELVLGSQRRKRVVICLAEELHGAGLGQFAETLHHLGGIAVELLESGARNRERELELALGLLDGLEQKLVHRQVALLGYPPEDGPVGKIVVVM